MDRYSRQEIEPVDSLFGIVQRMTGLESLAAIPVEFMAYHGFKKETDSRHLAIVILLFGYGKGI